jgi:RimJ/RimL family protein N-acetyltransferase
MGVTGPDDVPELAAGPFRLRAFDEGDLPLIERASRDPFIPLITTVPSVYSDAEGAAFLARQRDRVRAREGYPFAIEDPAAGRAIGGCFVSLRNVDLGRVSFGYWVLGSERGRGAAGHALRACVAWAVHTFSPVRLELCVEPWNEASIRTAEGVGFVREGLLRRWERVGDEHRDMLMFSLLPGEPASNEDRPAPG